jgi:hypothetical protein
MALLSRTQRLAAFAVVPVALLAVVVASGAGRSPSDDARATLDELEAKSVAASADAGSPSGSASPSVVARALASADAPMHEARRMLQRAKELRAAGEVARAEIAESTALEWALTARDEVDAVQLAADGDEIATRAADAGAAADQARARLDEAIARRSKLQATLDDLDREAQERAIDAGAPDAKAKKGGKP